jgi:hypothetical protein
VCVYSKREPGVRLDADGEEIFECANVMMLCPSVTAGTRITCRSLGYIGSFLVQYDSAQVETNGGMHPAPQ